MNDGKATKTTASGAKPSPPRGTVPRKHPTGPGSTAKAAVSREAQQLAAVILEVLAGVRTPTQAAAVLGFSVPRYYLWEQRAIEGLARACEPRPKGQVISQRHQITVPSNYLPAGEWSGHSRVVPIPFGGPRIYRA